MFRFGKRKASPAPPISSASNRFHILLLLGDAAALKLTEPGLALSGMDLFVFVDEDGHGGMIVTSDDPGPLKARCMSLGLKVGVVSIPRRRPQENSHMVSMDLRLTGEYQKLKKEWLDWLGD
jgi:hypothetical protein